MNEIIGALVVIACWLGILLVTIRADRHCQEAVDKWNRERPPDDPRKAQCW